MIGVNVEGERIYWCILGSVYYYEYYQYYCNEKLYGGRGGGGRFVAVSSTTTTPTPQARDNDRTTDVLIPDLCLFLSMVVAGSQTSIEIMADIERQWHYLDVSSANKVGTTTIIIVIIVSVSPS